MKIFKILLFTSIIILVVSAAIYINNQYVIYLEYLERTNYLETRISYETERNEILINLYQNRFSDERVENVARERLGLVRHNEIVFIPITGN